MHCTGTLHTAFVKFRGDINTIINELEKVGISNPEEWKLGDLLQHLESSIIQCQNSGTVGNYYPLFFN